MDTLFVNADGSPVSLIPPSIVSWQEAMRLVSVGKARPVKYYDNWLVRTISTSYPVPSIIMATKYTAPRYNVRYNRYNVFLRDNYCCQLCNRQFDVCDLTIDHVRPRSFGGGSEWANVTTACKWCNSRKGNDPTVIPVNKPYKPTYFDLIRNKKKHPIIIHDEEWQSYLDWPKHLVIFKEKK